MERRDGSRLPRPGVPRHSASSIAAQLLMKTTDFSSPKWSPLSSPRPTDDLPRGHACVGMAAEKKKSTWMMRSARSPHAKVVLFSSAYLSKSFTSRAFRGMQKGGKHAWSSHISPRPNSPAGPSPPPRPVFSLRGPYILATARFELIRAPFAGSRSLPAR